MEEMQQSTIDNYTGMSIKVCFCELIARRPTDVFFPVVQLKS